MLHSLVVSLTVSLVALAISALSRSARVAGLAFFGLLVVLELARVILWAMYRVEELALLSVQANLRLISSAVFGTAARGLGGHWAHAAVVLTVTGLACLAVLRSRVRAVDIVK